MADTDITVVLLSIEDIADLLGTSVARVRAAIKRCGVKPTVTVRRRQWFKGDDTIVLKAMLDSMPTKPRKKKEAVEFKEAGQGV